MQIFLLVLLVIQLIASWGYEYTDIQQQISQTIADNFRYALQNYDVESLLAKSADSVEYINTVVEIFRDGLSSRGRNLQNIPDFPSHTGLNETCSNKLCLYMQYLFSCQAIGIDQNKICSSYLVGRTYGCTDYPHGQYDIYNAPSTCLQQYMGFLQLLMGAANGNPQGLQNLINGYLFQPNFQEGACSRRCYQRYQNYSNDFLLNCNAELKQNQQSYPLVYGYSHYQQFRSQACNVNATGANCYETFSSMASSGSSGPVSPFNMQCAYTPSATSNKQILAGFCARFSTYGCCAASGMQIIFANQMNSSNPNVWPPCLMNYFRHHCPTIDLNDFCSEGSISTQSVFHGSFVLPSTAARYINVYNKTSLLIAQGALTNALASAQPALALQPYNLDAQYPFSISINGYSYSNATDVLTPADGTPATAEADYLGSTQGNFTYQVYMQNLSPTQAQTFQNVIANPNFKQIVAMAFGAPVSSVSTSAFTFSYSNIAPANVEHSAGAPRMLSMVSLVIVTLGMAWWLARE